MSGRPRSLFDGDLVIYVISAIIIVAALARDSDVQRLIDPVAWQDHQVERLERLARAMHLEAGLVVSELATERNPTMRDMLAGDRTALLELAVAYADDASRLQLAPATRW